MNEAGILLEEIAPESIAELIYSLSLSVWLKFEVMK